MTRKGESCYRVYVRGSEPVTRYSPPCHGGRRTKRLNMSLWAPIVSAHDADAALAKVHEMYPDIRHTAEPEFLHGPGNHRGEASNLQEPLLARAGWA